MGKQAFWTPLFNVLLKACLKEFELSKTLVNYQLCLTWALKGFPFYPDLRFPI